jgi:hypothetical protein
MNKDDPFETFVTGSYWGAKRLGNGVVAPL